jgi:hypothetical protein
MKRKSLFTKDFLCKDNKFVKCIRKEAKKSGEKLAKKALKQGYNPHEANDIFKGLLNLAVCQCVAKVYLRKEK